MRVALVIGNSAYKHAPALANPKNDAEGVTAALKRLKFEVLAGVDLDKPAMERLLQAYARAIETADVALVFYAGHGLQVHGRNYLVPVDGKLDRESDLPFQAVALDLIQGLMEQGTRTSIMILDACRDNPLARNLARGMGTRSTGIGRGLGETKAGIGTLIVYATQPGNVALDGDEKHSPFTLSLLKHMEAPGLEIRQVLTRVRNDVITATREKQVPWDSSSLRGDFFFAAAPGAVTPPGPAPAAPTLPPSAQGDESLFWQTIKDSKNAADFKAYLARYPQGIFAELAKIRIAEIEKAAIVIPPPPAPNKPAPPAVSPAPQRTSSWLVDRIVWGMADPLLPGVASARACRARCISDAGCKAWRFTTRDGVPDSAGRAGHCALIRQFDGSAVVASPGMISGVIGATPAAAPAQPAVPARPAAPLPAVAQEIVRAAEAKQAGGSQTKELCQRAAPLALAEDDKAFVARGQGAWRLSYGSFSDGHNFCTVWRIASVALEAGKRCANVRKWGCDLVWGCGSETVRVCP